MMNSLALVLVAATRVLIAVESGNIADALSAQKPFAANEGFAFEATFNCANANRHPAGVALMPVEDGPVLAINEMPDGFEACVTEIRDGKSNCVFSRPLPYPKTERGTADLRIAYDAGRKAVTFSVKGGPSQELPAPAGVAGATYRIVPSQVPRRFRLTAGVGEGR